VEVEDKDVYMPRKIKLHVFQCSCVFREMCLFMRIGIGKCPNSGISQTGNSETILNPKTDILEAMKVVMRKEMFYSFFKPR
jgi:hypothetical protein